MIMYLFYSLVHNVYIYFAKQVLFYDVYSAVVMKNASTVCERLNNMVGLHATVFPHAEKSGNGQYISFL